MCKMYQKVSICMPESCDSNSFAKLTWWRDEAKLKLGQLCILRNGLWMLMVDFEVFMISITDPSGLWAIWPCLRLVGPWRYTPRHGILLGSVLLGPTTKQLLLPPMPIHVGIVRSAFSVRMIEKKWVPEIMADASSCNPWWSKTWLVTICHYHWLQYL